MEFLAHCAAAINLEDGLYLSLFLAGLVGGFTHCAGMCGPFVVAQACARAESCESDNENRSHIRHWKYSDFFMKRLANGLLLPYHLGRVTTYVGLAMIAAGVTNIAFMYSPYKDVMAAFLLCIAGFMFVVSALPALARYTSFKGISFPFLSQGLAQLARPFFIDPRGWRGYVIGLLLGFLPCGLVMAALMAVSASGDVMTAAGAMVFFGLGTIPALFLVGMFSQGASRRWPHVLKPLSRGVMALNGIGLFALAGRLVL
ncbi:MAG: sulfite exporter TauE/SafE family protein [Rhodospirillales bacterium]|nr:sulfite exporter TauE/SafE family protein [Rhodospirillales bacterium]